MRVIRAVALSDERIMKRASLLTEAALKENDASKLRSEAHKILQDAIEQDPVCQKAIGATTVVDPELTLRVEVSEDARHALLVQENR